MGDFNAIKNHNEQNRETICKYAYFENLNMCCKKAGVEELRYMGRFLTLSDSREGDEFIACKLDRTFINYGRKLKFLYSTVTFFNHSLSNHSSCLANCGLRKESKKISFKFFNMWVQHERFLEIVKVQSKENVMGNFIFKLVTKLKKATKYIKGAK